MTDRSQKEIATMEGQHFDIGLMGMWYGPNYGSVMTYYALNTILKKMGYSVLMIDKHYSERDFELDDQLHSRKFAKAHYENFFPAVLKEEHDVLNDYCDTFILGSDQVWNYGVAKNFGRNFYFGFAADNKRKISYGSSFGHAVSFTPISELPEITRLLQRFDAISVREDEAVNVLKDEFGIEGTQVLDPVFMLTKEEYQTLIEESTINEEEKYMLAYILNPTPEIRDMLVHISEKKGLKLIVILDGNKYKRPEFVEELNFPNIVDEIMTQDWLKYIQNAECVITDSCHGASFTLLFERPLICLGNVQRGMSRFYSLTKLFEISNRLFTEPSKVKEHMELLDFMDYTRIQKIMKMERERSGKWLKKALEEPKIFGNNIKNIPKKECCSINQFEYALYGMNGDSYEDVLGYFGLYKTMVGLNYSVLMIPRVKEIKGKITPLRYRMNTFANRYYPRVSRMDGVQKLIKTNEICLNVMAGPGNIWDEKYGELLGFAAKDKKKLYYEKLTKHGISPMALLTKEDYDALVEQASVDLPKKYIAIYTQKDQEELVEQFRKDSQEVVALDDDQMVEDWIASIVKSESVVTDSIEAAILAIIYHKPLILIPGKISEEQILQLKLQKHIFKDKLEIVKMATVAEKAGKKEQEEVIKNNRRKMRKKLERKMKYRKPVREKISFVKRKVISGLKSHMPVPVKAVAKKILKRQ